MLFLLVQTAFSFLFGDDRFVKRYHKEQNEDPYAEVSSWTADCCRTVKFAAPLNAPNVIKKVIGKLWPAKTLSSVLWTDHWRCKLGNVSPSRNKILDMPFSLAACHLHAYLLGNWMQGILKLRPPLVLEV